MSEEEKQVAEAIPAAAEEKTVERDLVINSHASEVDIALLEDNILVELHREKTNNQFAVGDVYLGRVKKLLPGLNAAFVDVGYPKEAFLHYLDLGFQAHSLLKFKKMVVAGEDVSLDKFKLDPDLPKNGKIADIINVGDLIPVQIAKDRESRQKSHLQDVTLSSSPSPIAFRFQQKSAATRSATASAVSSKASSPTTMASSSAPSPKARRWPNSTPTSRHSSPNGSNAPSR